MDEEECCLLNLGQSRGEPVSLAIIETALVKFKGCGFDIFENDIDCVQFYMSESVLGVLPLLQTFKPTNRMCLRKYTQPFVVRNEIGNEMHHGVKGGGGGGSSGYGRCEKA